MEEGFEREMERWRRALKTHYEERLAKKEELKENCDSALHGSAGQRRYVVLYSARSARQRRYEFSLSGYE